MPEQTSATQGISRSSKFSPIHVPRFLSVLLGFHVEMPRLALFSSTRDFFKLHLRVLVLGIDMICNDSARAVATRPITSTSAYPSQLATSVSLFRHAQSSLLLYRHSRPQTSIPQDQELTSYRVSLWAMTAHLRLLNGCAILPDAAVYLPL